MNLQTLNFWFSHWVTVYADAENQETELIALGAIKALYHMAEFSPAEEEREYAREEIAMWWRECEVLHGQPPVEDVDNIPMLEA